MKLTTGKFAGLEAVSNPRGVIAAALMDHGRSLQKAFDGNATEAQRDGLGRVASRKDVLS